MPWCLVCYICVRAFFSCRVTIGAIYESTHKVQGVLWESSKKTSPLKDERLVSYCGGTEVDAVPLFYWNAAGVECRAFHRVGVIG